MKDKLFYIILAIITIVIIARIIYFQKQPVKTSTPVSNGAVSTSESSDVLIPLEIVASSASTVEEQETREATMQTEETPSSSNPETMSPISIDENGQERAAAFIKKFYEETYGDSTGLNFVFDKMNGSKYVFAVRDVNTTQTVFTFEVDLEKETCEML
jgi:cytoskeletal protein RodZ